MKKNDIINSIYSLGKKNDIFLTIDILKVDILTRIKQTLDDWIPF